MAYCSEISDNGCLTIRYCYFEWIRPILTPSDTLFLGSTRLNLPNGISIGPALFAQYVRVTNTQTDTQTALRATSVATARILCPYYN